MSLFDVFAISGSAVSAQSQRLNAVASNLANADSVGANGSAYRAKHVVFEESAVGATGASGVRVSQVVESSAPFPVSYDPENPLADDNGYVASSNVNVVDEMVDMISASKSYQTNVEVMNTAKNLLLKTLTIGQ